MDVKQTAPDPRTRNRLHELLSAHEDSILAEWVKLQRQSTGRRDDLIDERALRAQSAHLLRALREATQSGAMNADSQAFDPVRQQLSEISSQRARQGFTPRETALFVFSLKSPLLAQLQREMKGDAATFAAESLSIGSLLDELGLFTTDVHVKTREDVIARQQRELLELSTPVVTLWQDILALPLIGTLDSARTQVVMESLLQRIVETGSRIAILDITGVPTVDTLVAQHLLKTVAAARLMGADCLISGIRPQIAQTIVHLGVDLSHVTTKASLREAFAVALQRTQQRVVSDAPTGRGARRDDGQNGNGNGNGNGHGSETGSR